MANFYRNSPPPLQHPVPTHPAYIPDPPSTPASPQGYQRFTSSPGPPAQQQQQHQPQYTHVPAYASPYQPSHPNPHLRPQPQQPVPPQPGIPPPDFAAWGMNDATAQFGMQLGQSAVAAGQQYVQKNFGGIVPATYVKHHFNVSNSYVINKIRVILFPWTHKPWSRRSVRSEQGQTEWAFPRDDINSPDLYIPLMAVVTYVMIVAFQAGLSNNFNPAVLGQLASRAFSVILIEFCFLKLGSYLLNVQGGGQGVDLIAYGGYKFVGVIITLIFGFNFVPFGSTMYGVVFVYAFLSNAFFLLRSLRSVVLPDATTNAGTVHPAQRRRRITFLFLHAVSQVLYMWILVKVPA